MPKIKKSNVDKGRLKQMNFIPSNKTPEIKKIESVVKMEKKYKRSMDKEMPGNIFQNSYTNKLNSLPPGDIDRMFIDLLSDEEKLRIAGPREIKESSSSKTSTRSGVNSSFLGPNYSKGILCMTCMDKNCTGHAGKITFPKPIIEPLHVEFVCDIVQCMCHNCGAFLLSNDNYKTYQTFSKKEIRDICSTSIYNCPVCDKPSHLIHVMRSHCDKYGVIIYKSGSTGPYGGVKHSKELDLMPVSVLSTLLDLAYKYDAVKKYESGHVSVQDVFKYNFDVRNLITSILLVIPPNVRSTFTVNRFEVDSLTKGYSAVIKANKELISDPTNIEKYHNLVMLVRTLTKKTETSGRDITVNYVQRNTRMKVKLSTKISKGGPRDIDSVSKTLGGKDGTYRLSVPSVRSGNVIKAKLTIDKRLPHGSVKLPRDTFFTLGIEVAVTEDNLQDVYKLKEKSKDYPSGYIRQIKKKGSNIWKRYIGETIEVGDEVLRNLQVNDIVLVIRFPALFKRSIGCYRALIHDDPLNKTVSVSYSDLEGMNGDCDGDTVVVRAISKEEHIASVAKWMAPEDSYVSGSSGSYVGGLVMDSLAGAILMSKRYMEKDAMSDEDMRFYMASFIKDPADIEQAIESLDRRLNNIKSKYENYENFSNRSPRMLLSSVLPEGLFYESPDDFLVIIDGIIMTDVGKGHFGSSSNCIALTIMRHFDNLTAMQTMSKAQWLTSLWINYYGVSYGIPDIFPDTLDKSVRNASNSSYDEVRLNMIETEMKLREAGEDDKLINDVLLKLSDQLNAENFKRIDPLFPDGTNTRTIMETGKFSKGILTQCNLAVGPVVYFNERLKLAMRGERVFPFHPRRRPDDITPPEERGFYKSAYNYGITPSEYIGSLAAGLGASILGNIGTATHGETHNHIALCTGDIITDNGSLISSDGKLLSLSSGPQEYDPQKLGVKRIDIASFVAKLNHESV